MSKERIPVLLKPCGARSMSQNQSCFSFREMQEKLKRGEKYHLMTKKITSPQKYSWAKSCTNRHHALC